MEQLLNKDKLFLVGVWAVIKPYGAMHNPVFNNYTINHSNRDQVYYRTFQNAYFNIHQGLWQTFDKNRDLNLL